MQKKNGKNSAETTELQKIKSRSGVFYIIIYSSTFGGD